MTERDRENRPAPPVPLRGIQRLVTGDCKGGRGSHIVQQQKQQQQRISTMPITFLDCLSILSVFVVVYIGRHLKWNVFQNAVPPEQSMFSASEMLISFIINSDETMDKPKKSNRECGINCIHISSFCINAKDESDEGRR